MAPARPLKIMFEVKSDKIISTIRLKKRGIPVRETASDAFVVENVLNTWMVNFEPNFLCHLFIFCTLNVKVWMLEFFLSLFWFITVPFLLQMAATVLTNAELFESSEIQMLVTFSIQIRKLLRRRLKYANLSRSEENNLTPCLQRRRHFPEFAKLSCEILTIIIKKLCLRTNFLNHS